MNAYGNLVKYFSSLVDQINGEAKQASTLTNPAEIGAHREGIVKRLFERHLPRSCDVFRGGYLFNIEGERSRQIDVIATTGLTPRFQMPNNGSRFAPLEGTLAIAEVKSHLGKEELLKALTNFASVPRLSLSDKAVNPLLRIDPQVWKDWPYKIVFAFDGIQKETLIRHVWKFYTDNVAIPEENKPAIIIVLNKYNIFRIKKGFTIVNSDGKAAERQPTPGQYLWFDNHTDALSVVDIVTELQKRAFLANHIRIDYADWHDRLVDEITRGSHRKAR